MRAGRIAFRFERDDKAIRDPGLNLHAPPGGEFNAFHWDPVRDIVLSVKVNDEVTGESLFYDDWDRDGSGAKTPILEFCFGLFSTVSQLDSRGSSDFELPEYGTFCDLSADGDAVHITAHHGSLSFTTSFAQLSSAVTSFVQSVRDYITSLAPSLSTDPRIPEEMRRVILAG